MTYRQALIAISLLLLAGTASAEERWISVTLERTPIVTKTGKVVDRPVVYARNRHRITTGGEWVVPQVLQVKWMERYQSGKNLLVLVDVPPGTVLPGNTETSVKAEAIKKDVFKIVKPKEAESGVTK